MKDFIRDLFIPHTGNDHAPHSLRQAAMVGMMAMVLVSFAVANVQSLIWTSSEWMISTILPAVIVTDTNEERESNTLQPLRRNDTLDRAATLKAQHMAANEYFAHYSPDGVTPWHWFDEAGYSFVHAGENLAIYFTDSSEVVDAWMDSPTHRANILNNNYREIGVGIAKGEYEGYETVYVVQLFGTQAANIAATTDTERTDMSEDTSSTVATQAESDSGQPEVAGVQEAGSERAQTTIATDTKTETNTTTRVTKDDTVVVYSKHMATSTGGVPATIAQDDNSANAQSTPSILSLATKPNTILQFTYAVLGGFVFFALLLSIVIDVRRQQPRQIVYGVGLLAVMLILLHVHLSISTGVLIA